MSFTARGGLSQSNTSRKQTYKKKQTQKQQPNRNHHKVTKKSRGVRNERIERQIDQEIQREREEREKEQESACVICFGALEFFAVMECHHDNICSDCSVRMRSMFDNYACPVCMTVCEYVILSDDRDKKYEDYDLDDLFLYEEAKAYVVSQELLDLILAPTQFKCPNCDKSFKTINALKNHLGDAHRLYYCQTCLEKRKCFLSEQELYTAKQLKKHATFGDPSKGMKPHPVCKFCPEIRIYDDEELYEHCKDHLTCFLCDKNGIEWQYFRDYNHLEQHFEINHYLCPDPVCKSAKMIAFDSELEYKAHLLKCHKNTLSKEDIDALKKVNLSFSLSRRGDTPQTRTVTNVPPSNTVTNRTNNKPMLTQSEREEGMRMINERISELLGSEEKKRFTRDLLRYRDGEIPADSFYVTYLSLFGKTDESMALLEQIIEMIPNAKKQTELRMVKEQQDEFPELGGSGTDSPSFSVSYRSLVTPTKKTKTKSKEEFPSLGNGRPPMRQAQKKQPNGNRTYAKPNNAVVGNNFPTLGGTSNRPPKITTTRQNAPPKKKKQPPRISDLSKQEEFPTLGGMAGASQPTNPNQTWSARVQQEQPKVGGLNQYVVNNPRRTKNKKKGNQERFFL
eukprot:TRINITY_DN3009_c0_g1_i1.p1 TRINITY_DN3009_c0_g1~~TRINITY_DN3009_c0_g1_i1.p1  ORF type:complete len:622 (-),score=121.26 TRINITY_DN3009_c0_g1_i1:31-1896(-)